MDNYKEELLKSLQAHRESPQRAPSWSVQDMISRPLSDVKPVADTTLSKTSQLTLTSKPLAKASTGAAESFPFPIPHGKTYSSLHTLTVDVMNRCTAAGWPLDRTLSMVEHVISQFEEMHA